LQSTSPKARQEAAKAAQVAMTAAAVVMASKHANKTKDLVQNKVVNSTPRKHFKHSLKNGKKTLFQIVLKPSRSSGQACRFIKLILLS
jgi:hypothetical protein